MSSKKTTKKVSKLTNKKINNLAKSLKSLSDSAQLPSYEFVNKINEYDRENLLEDIVYKFLAESNIEEINTKNAKEKIAQSLIELASSGDIKAIKEILSIEQKAHVKKIDNKEYSINIEFTSIASDEDNTEN